MEKIRLLVVDDSPMIRRIICDCFRTDPEIEVVGVAETGVIALQQFEALKPDVVTLDVEMPEMGGLETLENLRARSASLPVIMFSQYTQEGARETIRALELGASDVLAKPGVHSKKGGARAMVKSQLSARIRALGRRAKRATLTASKAAATSHTTDKSESVYRIFTTSPIEAIGIAISTGGPRALVDLVEALSPKISVPIFITQHMPPMFTKILAERLSTRGTLPALEAAEGMSVEPGRIYIAPGDYHLEVETRASGAVIRLSKAPLENSCRPSADVMFRSLADTYGSALLGLVMTGMGNDGKKGCEVIKSRGATVIAQDEASSVVWGMPRAVVMAGLADEVLPLDAIAKVINANCCKEER